MIETWNACFAIYNMLAVALLADDTGAGLTGPDLLVWHALDTGQDQGSGAVVWQCAGHNIAGLFLVQALI